MTSKFSRVIIILAAVILLSAGVSASIQQVSIMANGPVFEITEKDGYIYSGQGGEVWVYDGTSLDKILNLNWSKAITRFHEPLTLGNRIMALNITGNNLVLLDGETLAIADISFPSAPTEIGSIRASGSAMAVSVDGLFAYAINSTTISVISIADPTHPTLLKTITSSAAYPDRATVAGGYLYIVSDSSRALQIFNIIDPANPVLASSIYDKAAFNVYGASGIAVKGNYAYLVHYDKGLKVIDISNKNAPAFTGVNISLAGASDIRIVDDTLYLSKRYGGVYIYDVKNMTPTFMGAGASEVGGYTEGLFVDGDYIYLAMESMGFEVYKAEDKYKPVRLIKVFTLGGVDSLVTKGNYAYLGGHNDGVWTYDITNPFDPEPVSFTHTTGRLADMVLKDPADLFIAASWSELVLVDITNPAEPIMKYNLFGGGQGYHLLLSEDQNYLYGTYTYNVTDPDNPTIENSTAIGGPLTSWTQNGREYLITYAPFTIWDITDKKTPAKISTFYQGGSTYKAAKRFSQGERNYVIATVDSYVVIYDITDATNPVQAFKRSYSGSWVPGTITLMGDRAIISGSGAQPNTRIFDLTQISTLPMVDSSSYGINNYDGRFLYGRSKFGLAIYSTEPVIIPTPTSTPIPTTEPTTVPTTEEPTTIPTTTEPTPTPTDPPACTCPTPTPPPPDKVCIEITTTGMRLIPCP